MTRYISLLVLIGFLAGPLAGQVRVSEWIEPATLPRATVCGDQYFVVWLHTHPTGLHEIWAARVNRDPLQWTERFLVYPGGAESITNLEIAAKGDVVLVVFEETDVGIDGRLVQPDNSIVELQEPISPDIMPAVASCDDYFLVAYQQGAEICGRKVFDDGSLEDPFWIVDGSRPSLASDGQSFLLVYNWPPVGLEDKVRGKKVDPASEPFDILEEGASPGTDVTYDAGSGRFLAAFREESVLGTRQCTFDQALGEVLAVRSDIPEENRFAVAASDINCLVACVQPPDDISGQRIDQVGDLVGHNEEVRRSDMVCSDPHVASDGIYYGVVWCELIDDCPVVWLDTVCSYQRHFCVENIFATARNNARHLALDPVTGWLHRVYQRRGGAAVEDSVFYTWSTDSGKNWYPSEFVGEGCFPCVVCTDQPNNHTWFCYRPSMSALACKVRLGLGDWRQYTIPSPIEQPENAGPSMSPIYDIGSPPGVYVVHHYIDAPTPKHIIGFTPVWLDPGPGETEPVHEADLGELLHVPTGTTTPWGGADIVHCAWSSTHGDDPCKAWYRRRVGGDWRPPLNMPPEWVSDGTPEPSEFPSVEAFGDRVYAVWTGNEASADIWRRWRQVEADNWDLFPEPISPENPEPSRDGEGSLGEVTAVWTETQETDNQVMVRAGTVCHTMHNPGGADLGNAHIASAFVDNPNTDSVMVFATWTEQIVGGPEPEFEMMFACSTYHLAVDAVPDYAFYDCGVGDSVKSRYCLARDGYARWREFRVDYGREQLRYRLPYLSPHCVYRLRAVLYQASKDVCEQSFALDGVPQGRVRLRPFQPETVWVTIPRDLYRRDFGVVLDIDRVSGDYASVAELKVFELFPFMVRKGGQGPGLSLSESGTEPLLRVTGANPFHGQASIAYWIPRAQQACVRLYDAQGRVVRELASGPHMPGQHLLIWDGRDALDRRVAAGAYFAELRTASAGTTRKLTYAP